METVGNSQSQSQTKVKQTLSFKGGVGGSRVAGRGVAGRVGVGWGDMGVDLTSECKTISKLKQDRLVSDGIILHEVLVHQCRLRIKCFISHVIWMTLTLTLTKLLISPVRGNLITNLLLCLNHLLYLNNR